MNLSGIGLGFLVIVCVADCIGILGSFRVYQSEDTENGFK